MNNILEISKLNSKGGRVPIKIALLKVHEDSSETNKNGLHWKEEYVEAASESAKMMPICAEFFTENKDIPLGHGLTDTVANDDGLLEPQFLDSETVGVIESASIETVNDGDSDIKVLVGNGYLYNQRYPNFVNWVRQNYAKGEVDTSIEIMGLGENNNQIVYEEEKPTQDFRTPKEFVFSGTSIISVTPADDSAVVLEIAEKNTNKEEQPVMDFDMNEIKSVIQTTISELNDKEEEFTKQISELNETIASKDAEIATKDATISELNATVEQVEQALDDLRKEQQGMYEEREALEKELGELKAQERLAALDNAISGFSEEEQQYAEMEINSFKSDPEKGDIDAIVNKIYGGIGRASKKAFDDARVAEQNSANDDKQNEVIDIFSEMIIEQNSDVEEDIDIFN